MNDSPRPSKLLAYLQLFRAPNVFTAIADVSMGYLVSAGAVLDAMGFALLIAASALMYTAGMVLNDVFDLEVDIQERPSRPLPSGRISPSWARVLGFSMLGAGVGSAWLAGMISSQLQGPAWRPGVMALLLAACILLYDAVLKKTPLGPIVMGSCRFLNVLLGMSLHAAAQDTSWQLIGYDTSHWMIAAGIGIYIVGVTVFARSEVTESPRGLLIAGVLIMVCGIGLLAAFPSLHRDAMQYRIEPTKYWPLTILIMSFWIVRRCFVAIAHPKPAYVQAAIKFCLLSLIMLDATLCLLVCPPPYSIGILALLIPAATLGRWIYST